MTKLLISANTEWYLYNFRLSLAQYLRQQDFEVVAVSPPGKYAQALRESGFRWISWDVGRQSVAPWIELSSLIQLIKIYRRERPDLVHHHTIKPVIYGSLAARMANVTGVVNSITGRGYIFLGDEFKARLLKLIVNPLYRLAFNFPGCGVIFENEVDRQYFLDHHFISPGRTWLIEGVGVDPERFKPTPEPEGTPVVLLAARMLWDKGVGVLVEAARILRQEGSVARIVLVGEPDPGNPATVETETLEQWHREGVIEWWGWKPDMPSVYQQSHIVTLPTMYGEGVPTTLLEAAASGRPLVATDIPGCRQIVIEGQNGYLVPANNPKWLADALRQLIGDRELRGRMGKASRQLVLRKFTHDQVNTATLTVYRSILDTAANASASNEVHNPSN